MWEANIDSSNEKSFETVAEKVLILFKWWIACVVDLGGFGSLLCFVCLCGGVKEREELRPLH